jgi:hypothetical protein
MEKDDRQLLSKVTGDNGLSWKPYSLRQCDEGSRNMATTVAGRVNIAGVCALSRRLMAIERARVLGRKPIDLQARALELEARGWTEERATGKQAVRGTH